MDSTGKRLGKGRCNGRDKAAKTSGAVDVVVESGGANRLMSLAMVVTGNDIKMLTVAEEKGNQKGGSK
eukprot:7732926-Ditylum_brightwellii.AAC.1